MNISNLVLAVILAASLSMSEAEKPNILLLGGNGFMGSFAVQELYNQFNIHVAHRGNWNWGLRDKLQPLISAMYFCDRSSSKLDKCQIPYDIPFKFIVDFSAYEGDFMKNTLVQINKFHFKPELYILISTDSVYEVSVPFKNIFSRETDSVRPSDPEEISSYKDFDDYGHEKLKAEELLIENGSPYFIFRLPDVIGPRDGTLRSFMVILWDLLSPSTNFGLTYPSQGQNKVLSFVYGPDVPRAISHVLETFPEIKVNEVYNFGNPWLLKLSELLAKFKEVIKSDSLWSFIATRDLAVDGSDNPTAFYPSVTRGPIDTTKFVTDFPDFKFTPHDTAVKETCLFFKDILDNAEEHDSIIESALINFFETFGDQMTMERDNCLLESDTTKLLLKCLHKLGVLLKAPEPPTTPLSGDENNSPSIDKNAPETANPDL